MLVLPTMTNVFERLLSAFILAFIVLSIALNIICILLTSLFFQHDRLVGWNIRAVDGEHLNCEERVLASVQYIYNSMFIKIKPKTIACKKLATSKKKSET